MREANNKWPSEEFNRQCPDFMRRAVSPVTPEQMHEMEIDLTEGIERAEARVNGSPAEKARLREELNTFVVDTLDHGKQDEGDFI